MNRLISILLVLHVQPQISRGDDTFAFVNVRVFDGVKTIPTTNVVVRGDRILAVGSDVELPVGAKIVAGAGKTLLPGFIDCHTHVYQPAHLRQAAVFGVTTELDMLTDPRLAASMRTQQQRGAALQRADILSAGFCATPAGGHGTEYGFSIPTIDNAENADAFVAARLQEGSDYIKIIYDDGRTWGSAFEKLGKAAMVAVVDAAHRRNKLVVAHVGTREDARDAIGAGVDGLAHLFADRLPDEQLLRLAAERKVFVVPTLTVLQSGVGIATGASLVEDTRLNPFLAPSNQRHLGIAFRTQQPVTDKYPIARASALAFHQAGTAILVGTDAPNPGVGHGVSLHRELELLVEAGLPPRVALNGATAAAAKAFRLDDRGRIAPALLADLVLVKGDPTKDIQLTRDIIGVWKRGKPIDREAFRKRVSTAVAQRENAKRLPPPDGLAAGLISDFEGDGIGARFGAGWMISTDGLMGGKSTAKTKRVEDGVDGSRGSLRIEGQVDDRPAPRWAGAIFSPGKAPFASANLSSKQALSFWTKGDGKRYTLMLFTKSGGAMPSVKTFVAGPKWQPCEFRLSDFDGNDGSDVTGLLFGSSTEQGSFQFQLDNVQLK